MISVGARSTRSVPGRSSVGGRVRSSLIAFLPTVGRDFVAILLVLTAKILLRLLPVGGEIFGADLGPCFATVAARRRGRDLLAGDAVDHRRSARSGWCFVLPAAAVQPRRRMFGVPRILAGALGGVALGALDQRRDLDA